MSVLVSTLRPFLDLHAEVDEMSWAAYEKTVPHVFEAYHRGWGLPGRGRWSTTALASAVALREREARAAEIVTRVEAELRSRGWTDGDLPTVLVVGGGSSNGWVTTYSDAPSLFLALELLPDPPHDEVLVVHEAVHVLQARAGGAAWPDDVAATLFAEGLAVVASRQLRPGLTDSAHLWFDDAHDDWARECAEHEAALRGLVASHADSTDTAVLRSLFTLGGRADWPARAGYWLGDRLLGDQDPASLLGWTHDEVLTWCRSVDPG